MQISINFLSFFKKILGWQTASRGKEEGGGKEAEPGPVDFVR